MSVDISKYFPNIYKSISEIEELIRVENEEFDKAANEIESCNNNQFIVTADEIGIAHMEKQLGIIANPEIETLNFRRSRLLNRISMQPPFTLPFLRQKLDEVIGINQYTLTIDYNNYTIYVESVARNANYAHEISVTMTSIKPANMVFINVPTIITPILLNEVISTAKLIYNYKLGTTWILGKKPFISFTEEEIIKMANIPSVTQDCLVELATNISSKVTKVLINDTTEITEFISNDVLDDGKVLLSYNVLRSENLTAVNNIKIMGEDGTIYFDSDLYAPIENEILLKHTITFKEG